jgi:predicted CXXCH cytochrome family protein
MAAACVAAGTALLFASPHVPAPANAPTASSADAELPATLEFVGSDLCGRCHGSEAASWRESQHARAMQPADATHVLAASVGGPLHVRRGKFSIQAIGPDGKSGEFPVRYTFGVDPLQQYLVVLTGGRLQAFTWAWDVRAHRWFDLYPKEKLAPGDELHWAGRQQNWNYMCADCHSTDVRKRYDPASGSYDTRFAEISVGCESCHGPGSRHVAWMTSERAGESGLSVSLRERSGVQWTPEPRYGTATRSVPRKTETEIEVCAQCHSRRSQIAEGYRAGAPFLDHYRPAFLTPPLYQSDGQQRDEVYVWGSFLQSKMYAKGVTCSDCHEPHGGGLRAQGNALCGRCHEPARFDTPSHHHHPSGSPGAACVACHMPTRTYMQIDARHDHSLRVPRPADAVAFGVPQPCESCHKGRGAAWAASTVHGWFGHDPTGFQRFTSAFHDGELDKPGAAQSLAAVAADASEPALVRASALARLEGAVDPAVTDAVTRGAHDESALVRLAAIDLAGRLPQTPRAAALLPLLADPTRAVRIAAADALAELEDSQIPADRRAARTRAAEEYVATQRYDADRPEARVNLGTYYARRQQYEPAQAEFRAALELDPKFVPAYVNAADAFRAQGRDPDAERMLEDARTRVAANADVEYAFGLTEVRLKNRDRALAALQRAAKLDPDQPRYAYTLAIALHSFERTTDALRVLDAAATKWPTNRNVLLARATMLRDSGQRASARKAAQDLARAYPGDEDAQALLEQLSEK